MRRQKIAAQYYCPEAAVFVCDGKLIKRLVRKLAGSASLNSLADIESLLGLRSFLVHYDPQKKKLYFLVDQKNKKLIQRIKRQSPNESVLPPVQPAQDRLKGPWERIRNSCPPTTEKLPVLARETTAIDGTELAFAPLKQVDTSWIILKGPEIIGCLDTTENKAWLYPAGVLLLSEADVFALFSFLSNNFFGCAPSCMTETDDQLAIELDFSAPLALVLPSTGE